VSQLLPFRIIVLVYSERVTDGPVLVQDLRSFCEYLPGYAE